MPTHQHLLGGLLSLLLSLFAAGLAAQGPYYVNGITGVNTLAAGWGHSAATPWKTIGFALANAAPQTVSTSDIVYVEGNQVYSPATNGEAYPLTPAYNISVEGTFVGSGQLPVLQIPAGSTGFAFPGNQWFNRNQVTYRYLVLDSGTFGMTMGAAPGFRHRPRVQDCTFRNQTGAGVRIENQGAAINDPRFFQNRFSGPGKGLEMRSTGTGAVTQPDVEENWFADLAGHAIDLEDTSPGGGNVGGLFRSNWFDRCYAGIRIRSAAGAVATNATIRTSRFADLASYAIEVVLDHPFDPVVTVDQCTMLRCGGGIRLTGTPLPGSYTLNLTKNVILDCTTGTAIWIQGQGNVAVASSDNLIEACTHGISVYVVSSGPSPLQFSFASNRDRVLRCTYGVQVYGGAPGGVTFASGLVCGNTSYGVWIATTSIVTMRSMTIADNRIGLSLASALPAASALDHLVFSNPGAGNADLQAPPGAIITHSCFQGTTWPGVGNLNQTNPLVLRPSYKLSPGSPCIDAGNPTASLPATDYEGDPRASVSALNGPARPDQGADEYVFAGSARPYGTGGFGLYNVFPRISAASPNASTGSTVQVHLSGAIMPVFAVPATAAICTFGWRDDHGSQPFDLAVYGMPGSYLWNEVAASFPLQLVSPTGTASVSHAIPTIPFLVGVSVHYQWFALMPAPTGIVASDGLRVTLGQ